MAIELGRMVTNLERLQQIMLLYPLVTWSCEITWQTKIITSPLPQYLWPPNLAEWWLTFRSSYPWCYYTLWSHGLVSSRDKLKQLYLDYHSAYGHQTWQDDVKPWAASTYNVTLPFSHMALQDQVTNWKHNISTNTVPMATKLGRMVTNLEQFLHIMLLCPLVTWSCKIT